MRFLKIISISIITVFFAACSSAPEANTAIVSKFHGLLPQIVQNDDGLLHGITLGMSLDSVKKFVLAGDSMSKIDENEYLFEGKLTPQKIYDYDCNFDEKGLKDLTLDIHLKDEKNADSLYLDFKNYFSMRYGASTESDGTTIWIMKDGKRPAKIILEENEDYLYGKLTITFFDKDFDPPTEITDSVPLP